METFSNLLEQLYYTAGTKAKAQLIADYIANTPDPDRGWAIAAMAGTLRFDFFKRNTVKIYGRIASLQTRFQALRKW